MRFKEIGAGEHHGIALDTSGNIWTWGKNNKGQLGLHNTTPRNVPQMVPDENGKPNSNKFKKVSAGGEHSAAIDMSGQVWSWGSNNHGQIGIGTMNEMQWQITKTKPFVDNVDKKEYKAIDIDCGGDHTLARDTDQYMWSWGRNTEYQLGGETDNSDQWAPVSFRRPGWSPLSQIAAGGQHSEVVSVDGSAAGFGSNEFTQAGNAAQNHWDRAFRFPSARGFSGVTQLPFRSNRVLDENGLEWSPAPYGKAKYVTAGYYHSLGIAQDSNNSSSTYQVWGWGKNEKGEIGSDAHTNYERTVQGYPAISSSATARDFKTLAAGKKFTVGLTNSGKVYTWGANDKGQLANGSNNGDKQTNPTSIATTSTPETPLEIVEVKFDGVNAPKKSVDASSGAWYVNAPKPNRAIGANNLTVDVLVTYKGTNGNNETTTLKYTYLGNPDTPNPPTPPNPPSPPPVATCTVSFNLGGAPGAIPSQSVPCGSLVKWPNNANPKWDNRWFNGWLVQGTNPAELWDFNKPVTKNMTLVAQWGGPYSFDMTPNKGPVEGGSTVTVKRNPGNRVSFKYVSVSAGQAHTLAVGSDGYVYSWGNNDSGQLGDGTTVTRSAAVRVQTPLDVRFLQVAAGGGHSLALDSNGNVWGWGQNNHGQVGNQSTSTRTVPVQVDRMKAGSVKFKEISAGAQHSLAVDVNGDAWSWGYNTDGILGLGNSGTDEWHPERVSGGVKFAHLSAGYDHSAGVDTSGEVWSWGNNDKGQLGNQGRGTDQWHPVKIVRKVNDKPREDSTGVIFKSVSAGNRFTIALADDGYAWGWGYNKAGQIGNNWYNDEWHPVRVYPSQDNNGQEVKFKEVSAGGCHVVGLDKDDWPYTWGCNANGRLGLASIPSTDQWWPRSLGIGYTHGISAGDVHSAAIVWQTQEMKTWGDSSPQLGRGDPVQGEPSSTTSVIPPIVDLVSVKFDGQSAQSINISKRSDGEAVWEVKTPPAPANSTGRVDVTFQWTLGENDVLKNKYLYFVQ